MKSKKIKIPIYFGEFQMIQVEDFSELEGNSKLEDLNYSHGMAFSEKTDNGYTRYTIAVRSDVTPDIIAHEALHIVSFLFGDRGIKMDTDNDEPIAYLLGWLVEQIHKFLDK